MNNYPAHLLCYGKGTDTIFSSASAPLYPGTAFSCPGYRDQDILLAGGFPAIHPDSAFPLSPTLQLNGDLGNFDAAAMQQIASVELSRHTSTRFRSYTLAPVKRVVVLADNQEKLFSFIDTYGSVLELQPLLLKGYHPDLTTAHNLEINCSAKECLIKYQVKSPVLTERCTYCGACGVVCPEDCLSEQLFLDFSKCSLCKECVTACQNNALDLHGIEQRKISAPALIILGDVDVDIKQMTKRIFRENELGQLFASIGEYLVDEVVQCNKSICQYLAPHKTGCTRCAMVCPEKAISLTGDGVKIDQERCTECGNCIATCPTGAMQYLRFTDQQFLEYWAELDVSDSKTVVIGDEAQLHRFWWRTGTGRFPSTFFMEYPNPEALTSMHFLTLYGTGIRRIILLTSEKERFSGAFTEQIDQTNQITSSLEEEASFVQISQTINLSELLVEDVGKQSAHLKVLEDHGNRRANIAVLLTTLLTSHTPSPSTLTGEAFSTFGTILCDEDSCTQCLACLSCCQVQALQSNQEQLSLLSNASHCVQCGSCVTICPENALTLQSGLILSDEFFNRKTISQAEPAKCKGCGKVFGTRKSLEKVMAILTAKNMWDSEDDLLSYCEDCRVVNLYKSGEK
jgi:ferredoxin